MTTSSQLVYQEAQQYLLLPHISGTSTKTTGYTFTIYDTSSTSPHLHHASNLINISMNSPQTTDQTGVLSLLHVYTSQGYNHCPITPIRP